MAYLDLDELEQISRSIWPFSVNRWNLWSFFDRDHFDGQSGSTRDKVNQFLAHHRINLTGGSIGLLTQCRMWGYVFNPISLFYCWNMHGELAAVIAEVHNTFGERHMYLLQHDGKTSNDIVRFTVPKAMHVSPFIAMDCIYRFTLAPLGDRLNVRIVQYERKRKLLNVHLSGKRISMTNRSVATIMTRYPLLTIKTIAAIHGQAIRLYLKGVPVVSHPGQSEAQLRQQSLLKSLEKNLE